jgi:hypothetical protein
MNVCKNNWDTWSMWQLLPHYTLCKLFMTKVVAHILVTKYRYEEIHSKKLREGYTVLKIPSTI